MGNPPLRDQRSNICFSGSTKDEKRGEGNQQKKEEKENLKKEKRRKNNPENKQNPMKRERQLAVSVMFSTISSAILKTNKTR